MKEENKAFYSVNLSMETIKLPPVSDILILAKKHPQGKIGVMESFRFIAPDEFKMVEILDKDCPVEAILINKKILKRIPEEEVVSILRQHVFSKISSGEAMKVDFVVKLNCKGITGEL